VARDLPIKNGLAERLEGEHLSNRTLAQGGASNRKPHLRELWRLEPELKGAGAAKAQMNALEGLKYHHITIM
jgi:hypothetical protein